MDHRYYAGLTLEKDRMFCAIVAVLSSNPDVIILNKARPVTVHVMKYDAKGTTRIDTGDQYQGYESHWVRFGYRGWVFYVQASDFYPFTDDNYPGLFNFLVYRRVGLSEEKQETYFEKYESIQDIDAWIDSHQYGPLAGRKNDPHTSYRLEHLQGNVPQGRGRRRARRFSRERNLGSVAIPAPYRDVEQRSQGHCRRQLDR